MVYYHGGRAGLHAGDLLVPSPPHVTDGCPVCTARAEGRVCTVGEFRRWLLAHGPSSRAALQQLEGVPDDAPMDPPSAEQAVYITSDLGYAQFYAARSGHGDLYRVEPVGPVNRTTEDHFPSWTCAAARVVQVVQRHVVLRRAERRELMRRWKKADIKAEKARAFRRG